MAKAEKKKEDRKKRGKYDEKIAVKGNFLDIMQSAAKNANDKSATPKEDTRTDLEKKVDESNNKR